MINVSDRFSDAIFQSHKIATKVNLVGSTEELPLIDGQVDLDISSAVRGTASLQFSDVDLVPTSDDDVLAPYGNELEVHRGIEFPDGTKEMVKLGKFVIQTTAVKDDPTSGVQIDVTASDKSQNVIDAILEQDLTVDGGTDFGEAIREVIADGVPIPSYNFVDKDAQTPTLTGSRGDDRWAFAQTMAAALGCDLFYDNEGILTLELIQVASNPSVISIIEGHDGVEITSPEVDEDPSLLDVSKELSRIDAHNKWIVVGDNPDDIEGTPPTGTAVDSDTSSPTRYGGKFGKKPEIWQSSFISDDQQAKDAAEGKKAKERGITLALNFGSLVHPALEPNDVVFVQRTRRSRSTGESISIANESHVIDGINIPLGSEGAMSARTRAIKVETLVEE